MFTRGKEVGIPSAHVHQVVICEHRLPSSNPRSALYHWATLGTCKASVSSSINYVEECYLPHRVVVRRQRFYPSSGLRIVPDPYKGCISLCSYY